MGTLLFSIAHKVLIAAVLFVQTMGSPGPTVKSSEGGSRRGVHGQENQAMEQVSPTEEMPGISSDEEERPTKKKQQNGLVIRSNLVLITIN